MVNWPCTTFSAQDTLRHNNNSPSSSCPLSPLRGEIPGRDKKFIYAQLSFNVLSWCPQGTNPAIPSLLMILDGDREERWPSRSPRVLLLYRMGQRSLVQWQLETKTRQRERSKVLIRDLFSSWLSVLSPTSSTFTPSASSGSVTEKPIYSPSPFFHSDSSQFFFHVILRRGGKSL